MAKKNDALREAMAADAAPAASPLDVERVRKWVKQLGKIRGEAMKLAAQLDVKTTEITRIEREVIPALLDEAGVESMTIDGQSISIDTLYAPHVLKENEHVFFKWLREHSFGALIKTEVRARFGMGEDEKAAALAADLIAQKLAVDVKQSVHSGTLKAFVKEQTSKGAALPDVLDIHRVRTTIIK